MAVSRICLLGHRVFAAILFYALCSSTSVADATVLPCLGTAIGCAENGLIICNSRAFAVHLDLLLSIDTADYKSACNYAELIAFCGNGALRNAALCDANVDSLVLADVPIVTKLLTNIANLGFDHDDSISRLLLGSKCDALCLGISSPSSRLATRDEEHCICHGVDRNDYSTCDNFTSAHHAFMISATTSPHDPFVNCAFNIPGSRQMPPAYSYADQGPQMSSSSPQRVFFSTYDRFSSHIRGLSYDVMREAATCDDHVTWAAYRLVFLIPNFLTFTRGTEMLSKVTTLRARAFAVFAVTAVSAWAVTEENVALWTQLVFSGLALLLWTFSPNSTLSRTTHYWFAMLLFCESIVLSVHMLIPYCSTISIIGIVAIVMQLGTFVRIIMRTRKNMDDILILLIVGCRLVMTMELDASAISCAAGVYPWVRGTATLLRTLLGGGLLRVTSFTFVTDLVRVFGFGYLGLIGTVMPASFCAALFVMVWICVHLVYVAICGSLIQIAPTVEDDWCASLFYRSAYTPYGLYLSCFDYGSKKFFSVRHLMKCTISCALGLVAVLNCFDHVLVSCAFYALSSMLTLHVQVCYQQAFRGGEFISDERSARSTPEGMRHIRDVVRQVHLCPKNNSTPICSFQICLTTSGFFCAGHCLQVVRDAKNRRIPCRLTDGTNDFFIGNLVMHGESKVTGGEDQVWHVTTRGPYAERSPELPSNAELATIDGAIIAMEESSVLTSFSIPSGNLNYNSGTNYLESSADTHGGDSGSPVFGKIVYTDTKGKLRWRPMLLGLHCAGSVGNHGRAFCLVMRKVGNALYSKDTGKAAFGQTERNDDNVIFGTVEVNGRRAIRGFHVYLPKPEMTYPGNDMTLAQIAGSGSAVPVFEEESKQAFAPPSSPPPPEKTTESWEAIIEEHEVRMDAIQAKLQAKSETLDRMRSMRASKRNLPTKYYFKNDATSRHRPNEVNMGYGCWGRPFLVKREAENLPNDDVKRMVLAVFHKGDLNNEWLNSQDDCDLPEKVTFQGEEVGTYRGLLARLKKMAFALTDKTAVEFDALATQWNNINNDSSKAATFFVAVAKYFS